MISKPILAGARRPIRWETTASSDLPQARATFACVAPMPLRSTRFDDRPCQGPDCPTDAVVAVADATTVRAWCESCAPESLAAWLGTATPVSGGCAACGTEERAVRAVLGVTTATYEAWLCPGHALAFLAHALEPDAWRALVADAGGRGHAVFWLSDVLYTADGGARRPTPIGLDVVRAAFAARRAQTNPWLDDIAPRAIGGAAADRTAVARAWHIATGLPCADALADQLVAQLHAQLQSGTAAERHEVEFLALREQYLPEVLAAFREADPLGACALALDAEPYQREARFVLRWINPEDLWAERPPTPLVRQALGWKPDDTALPATGLAAMILIAQRLRAEVILPLREAWVTVVARRRRP